MKVRHVMLAACCLLLAGAVEYARQWAITPEQAGQAAYRVELNESVYRHITDPQLADLEVLDADGVPVPATVQPAQLRTTDTDTRSLAWFPLPAAGNQALREDLQVISERDASGRVIRIQARSSDAPAAAGAAHSGAWLLDASGVQSGTALALELAWEPSNEPLDVQYDVLGSDNLRDWRLLQASTQLMDLSRDGKRLQHNRIALDARTRYLRLQPAGEGLLPPLTGVQLHLQESSDTPLAWYSLEARDADADTYSYELDARLPVTHADVTVDGIAAGTWRLESRNSTDAPWQLRAGPWTAYRLGDADAERSDTQAVNGGPVRDRYWRLVASQPPPARPTLQLGYRAESVVFVAAGKSPYVLAAGSTRSRRGQAPIDEILAQQRARHGRDWQPAPAMLGVDEERDGAHALRPPPGDWKTWLLWGVLALGTLVVGGFAVSLLREKRPAADVDQG